MTKVLMTLVLAATLLLSACGGSGNETDDVVPDPGTGAAGDPAGGIASNSFLTFEGATYRLAEILPGNLVQGSDLSRVGSATAANIDYDGSLDVFRRSGDGNAVYTRAVSLGAGVDVPSVGWLRWEREGAPRPN